MRFFDVLPLCHVIQQRVCVLHGGLFSTTNVTLDMINRIRRKREPPWKGMCMCGHVLCVVYVYIYMCTYVLAYICMCICVYVCTYVLAYMYVYMCICVYTCAYMCMGIYMYMCVYLYVCIYVYMYMYIYIHRSHSARHFIRAATME